MQTSDSSNLFQAEADFSVNEARQRKLEQTKLLGNPIETTSKPLAALIYGKYIWTAESGYIVRKSNLETGKTVQVYKGHTGPVTCLAFVRLGSQDAGLRATSGEETTDLTVASDLENTPEFLVTGSWDKTIRIWDTKSGLQVSSTQAHEDFVKCVLVDSTLKLLISGGSDKAVRFWDLESPASSTPLHQLGSLSEHTRPVEVLAIHALSESSAVLYTADTMGVVNVWELQREFSTSPRCGASLVRQVGGHRTGVTALAYGYRQLWTASIDQTVLIQQDPPMNTGASMPDKPLFNLEHPAPVKAMLPIAFTAIAEPYLLTAAGEVIRTYDLSADEPELLSEVDAHAHEVTSLTLWARRLEGHASKVEYWVVSTSLDSTIRKWRLHELIKPDAKSIGIKAPGAESAPAPPMPEKPRFEMTIDEERELAELLDSDED